MAKHNVLRFYAELKAYEPKIWRRFEINGEKTVAELAYAVMIMFEMRASHLFSMKKFVREPLLKELSEEFSDEAVKIFMEKYQEEMFKDIRYELPTENRHFYNDEEIIAADNIKLNQTANKVGTTFDFLYDFGDSWEISLVVEHFEKQEVPLATLPKILDGKRFGIVEDIGGVGGLEELVLAFKERSGMEYEHFINWIGDTDFDLEYFDKDEMNFRLKKLMRVYKEIYEYDLEPTKKFFKLLMRDN
ncbi:hypothetical protein LMxysn_0024 [Listeria monocytogenes]|uniref:plasmid pRiA4b ORF-3 family protein n=1 Tax=Listeria monocytogenes TaxID=1639 RepID=UPI000A1D40BD|nr:plasmid pRiA4b ORF-3 family protein [Listeria monocytogenes]ARM71659.1 hypothetical protein LMxysn_0024 [Listeria monocytogenes]